jgi:SprT protein
MTENVLNYVPQESVAYCQDLLREKPILCSVSNPRASKWGDFRFLGPEITVNKNLPESLFLLTLLHEIAHFHAYLAFGRKIAPHGKEWKTKFYYLCQPMIQQGAFGNINELVRLHMRNPKATLGADARLHSAAMRLMGNNEKTVSQLTPGEEFTFRKQRYRIETTLRKRIRCMQIATGKRFLFQPSVQIDAA